MPDESYRDHLELDAEVVAAASLLAARRYSLSDIVRAAIRSATLAAERGAYRHVPQDPQPAGTRAPRGGVPDRSKVSYVTTRADVARSDRALRAMGSSRRIVALRALQSFVLAEGRLYDAVMPGEQEWVWRQGAPRATRRPRQAA